MYIIPINTREYFMPCYFLSKNKAEKKITIVLDSLIQKNKNEKQSVQKTGLLGQVADIGCGSNHLSNAVRILGDEQLIIAPSYYPRRLTGYLRFVGVFFFFYSLNKYNIAVYLVPTTSASLSPRTVVRDLLHPFSKGV